MSLAMDNDRITIVMNRCGVVVRFVSGKWIDEDSDYDADTMELHRQDGTVVELTFQEFRVIAMLAEAVQAAGRAM